MMNSVSRNVSIKDGGLVEYGPSNQEGGIGEYEAQYDPNNDFAVFEVGDKTRGGLQSMQEKMNIADSVEDIPEIPEEDSDTEKAVGNYTKGQSALPQIKNAQAPSGFDIPEN